MSQTLYTISLHSVDKKQKRVTDEDESLSSRLLLGTKKWLERPGNTTNHLSNLTSSMIGFKLVLSKKIPIEIADLEKSLADYYNRIIGVDEKITVQITAIDNVRAPLSEIPPIGSGTHDKLDIYLKNSDATYEYYINSTQKYFKSDYTSYSDETSYKNYLEYLGNWVKCYNYLHPVILETISVEEEVDTIKKKIASPEPNWADQFELHEPTHKTVHGESQTLFNNPSVPGIFEAKHVKDDVFVCFFKPVIHFMNSTEYNLEPIMINDAIMSQIIDTPICSEYAALGTNQSSSGSKLEVFTEFAERIKKLAADYIERFEKSETVEKENGKEQEADAEAEDNNEEDEDSDDSLTVISMNVKKTMTPEDIEKLRTSWKNFVKSQLNESSTNCDDKERVYIAWIHEQFVRNPSNTFSLEAIKNIFEENYKDTMYLSRGDLLLSEICKLMNKDYDAIEALIVNPGRMADETKKKIIGAFSKSCLTESPGDAIESSIVYKIFNEYAENLFRSFPQFEAIMKHFGQKKFTQLMKESGKTMARRAKGMYYTGVKVNNRIDLCGTDDMNYETIGSWNNISSIYAVSENLIDTIKEEHAVIQNIKEEIKSSKTPISASVIEIESKIITEASKNIRGKKTVTSKKEDELRMLEHYKELGYLPANFGSDTWSPL